MNITVESKIDLTPAMKKIQSDEFWKEAATEWWKAYYDYVPYDTNNLRKNVTIKPKEIKHNVVYASTIYFGKRKGRLLHMKNGTRLWDEKAKQEKKDLLLIRSMQNWIDRNL